MNRTLGKNATKEICEAMKNLAGKTASFEAERLAKTHQVSKSRIYEITKNIRNLRNKRSDAGTSKWILEPGNDLWIAFQLVVASNQAPDLALETVHERIFEEHNRAANLPTLNMFRKLLNQYGFSKNQRKNKTVSYRLNEHPNPGARIRFDNSCLKPVYLNSGNRRALRIDPRDVNENHPLTKKNLLKVYVQVAVDDCTRRTHARYIAANGLTSRLQLEFELETYAIFGLPLEKISDNGGEMRKEVATADQLLNRIAETSGGFRHTYIEAHNAKSNGKVEGRHKFIQNMERLVLLAMEEGHTVTLENLNYFATQLCTKYNEININRTTGQTPMVRWHSRKILSRNIPFEILKSALLSDIFEVTMAGDVSVSFNNVKYQLPREQPFIDYISRKDKIKVIVPESIEVLLVNLPDDRADFWREVTKVIATPDIANDYKSVPLSGTETLRKQLVESRKIEIKATKAKLKTGEELPAIPYWNREVKIPQKSNQPLIFPQRTPSVSVEDIERIMPLPSSLASEPELTYWQAVSQFGKDFQTKAECKQFLSTIFIDESETILESEIQNAIENREFTERRRLLKAV